MKFEDYKKQVYEFVHKQLHNFKPEEIIIADDFFKLPSEDNKRHIALIVACTPNGAIWTWAANKVLKSK